MGELERRYHEAAAFLSTPTRPTLLDTPSNPPTLAPPPRPRPPLTFRVRGKEAVQPSTKLVELALGLESDRVELDRQPSLARRQQVVTHLEQIRVGGIGRD